MKLFTRKQPVDDLPLKTFIFTPPQDKDLNLLPVQPPSLLTARPQLFSLKGLFSILPNSDFLGDQPTKLLQRIFNMLGLLSRRVPVPVHISKDMVFSKGGPLDICMRCIIKRRFLDSKLFYCTKKILYHNCDYYHTQHNTCQSVCAPKRNAFKINFKKILEALWGQAHKLAVQIDTAQKSYLK